MAIIPQASVFPRLLLINHVIYVLQHLVIFLVDDVLLYTGLPILFDRLFGVAGGSPWLGGHGTRLSLGPWVCSLCDFLVHYDFFSLLNFLCFLDDSTGDEIVPLLQAFDGFLLKLFVIRLSQDLDEVDVDVVKVVEDSLHLLHEHVALFLISKSELDAKKELEVVKSVLLGAHDLVLHEETVEKVVEFDQRHNHVLIHPPLLDHLGEGLSKVPHHSLLLLHLVVLARQHLLDSQ